MAVPTPIVVLGSKPQLATAKEIRELGCMRDCQRTLLNDFELDSALDRAGKNTAGEVALEEGVDAQDRDHGDHHHRHLD